MYYRSGNLLQFFQSKKSKVHSKNTIFFGNIFEKRKNICEIIFMATKTEENEIVIPDRGLWRDLLAYFILGLCNNYGYNVMLSAAHDIIGKFHETVNILPTNVTRESIILLLFFFFKFL